MSTFYRCIEYPFTLFTRPALRIDLVVTENALSMYKLKQQYILKKEQQISAGVV